MNSNDFSGLPLPPEVLANLKSLGYETMTPIQAGSLPAVLEGKDVKAQAKTGSGKTAAFGIGLLQGLDTRLYQTQSLVVCPTRELADQVSKALRQLARPFANVKILTLCGGKPMGPQLASLDHPPHVVVGTPGRLLKHCQKGSLKLDQLRTLVLDEADRMLDMGFLDDINALIAFTPDQRQTLLYSATYPQEILAISNQVQKNPVEITVESLHDDSVIQQLFYEIGSGSKLDAIETLLRHFRPDSSVIFCNRKQQCEELAEALKQRGISAVALHGDLEQKDRDRVLVLFANGSIPVLIATDVAARGLDIKELAAVVNYELPHDPEVYIHRIGRTGRAGNEGLALSLFLPAEAPRVNAIEALLNRAPSLQNLPAVSEPNLAIKGSMQTLALNAGRKAKLRPGDILGALTATGELTRDHIGKIDIFDMVAYVAITRAQAAKALAILASGGVKGRKIQARKA
ncbi:ATP-dependent RNA helicase DbpA [Mangrovimicrobium sediminis]|uniref:ATP-dependent RNA helicase DbpA n=1 Tax=Mangrovimicrobium sediminis TaxID=2562682 RepID=A0A4Z0M9P7_9GAMM|nr:ATP-dependent RNA helicase DbpA [Haliea sp. SAOS-164]TGD76204.1 ATP-dependent RNA helicase DbpA [Haliea sp. SAOS-164]